MATFAELKIELEEMRSLSQARARELDRQRIENEKREAALRADATALREEHIRIVEDLRKEHATTLRTLGDVREREDAALSRLQETLAENTRLVKQRDRANQAWWDDVYLVIISRGEAPRAAACLADESVVERNAGPESRDKPAAPARRKRTNGKVQAQADAE